MAEPILKSAYDQQQVDSVPTVHVVTTDRGLREELRALVSGLGFSAKSFPSGRAFLQQYRNREEECLILDLDIESGQDTLESITTAHPDLTVIVIAKELEVSSAVGAMRGGATEVLETPFQARILRRLIEQAVHRA